MFFISRSPASFSMRWSSRTFLLRMRQPWSPSTGLCRQLWNPPNITIAFITCHSKTHMCWATLWSIYSFKTTKLRFRRWKSKSTTIFHEFVNSCIGQRWWYWYVSACLLLWRGRRRRGARTGNLHWQDSFQFLVLTKHDRFPTSANVNLFSETPPATICNTIVVSNTFHKSLPISCACHPICSFSCTTVSSNILQSCCNEKGTQRTSPNDTASLSTEHPQTNEWLLKCVNSSVINPCNSWTIKNSTINPGPY